MPRMTTAEYHMLASRRPDLVCVPKPPQAPERESELHSQIRSECKRRGWLVFSGAMHKRTWRTKGEPDFVILLPNGETALIEAKTRTGALSEDQIDVAAQCAALGHTVHTVRSLTEFVRILE